MYNNSKANSRSSFIRTRTNFVRPKQKADTCIFIDEESPFDNNNNNEYDRLGKQKVKKKKSFPKKNRSIQFICSQLCWNLNIISLQHLFRPGHQARNKNNKNKKLSSRPRNLKNTILQGIIIFATFTSFIYLTILVLDSLFHSYGNVNGIIDLRNMKKNNYQQQQMTQRQLTPEFFNVVINTYKRPDRLKTSVQHYAKICGRKYGVGQVTVVWAELDKEPPSVSSLFTDEEEMFYDPNLASVIFQKVEIDSLNSRFLPINYENNDNEFSHRTKTTEAVFMVDDDVQVDCRSLLHGFQAWLYHPKTLVGFYPRLHSEHKQSLREKQQQQQDLPTKKSYIYHSWVSVFLRNSFSIILTKACFLHSDYLEMYSNNDSHPKEIKEYVDKYHNCEDIAMAFMVANHTKYQIQQDLIHDIRTSLTEEQKLKQLRDYYDPIYVEGRVVDNGLLGGISTGGTGGNIASAVGGGEKHFTSRSDCVTDITNMYRERGFEIPLSSVKLKERSYVRHFPGFLWQIGPSNIAEWFPSPDLFMA